MFHWYAYPLPPITLFLCKSKMYHFILDMYLRICWWIGCAMWGKRSAGCLQSLLWRMEVPFTEVEKTLDRTIGGIIWGGKCLTDCFCSWMLWNAYLTSQKLLDMHVWISGRDWSFRYKVGSCQIMEGIYSQKTELPASDHHGVARIWLTLVLIINSGGMGEWPKTNRYWKSFKSWENGATLNEIHV